MAKTIKGLSTKENMNNTIGGNGFDIITDSDGATTGGGRVSCPPPACQTPAPH